MTKKHSVVSKPTVKQPTNPKNTKTLKKILMPVQKAEPQTKETPKPSASTTKTKKQKNQKAPVKELLNIHEVNKSMGRGRRYKSLLNQKFWNWTVTAEYADKTCEITNMSTGETSIRSRNAVASTICQYNRAILWKTAKQIIKK